MKQRLIVLAIALLLTPSLAHAATTVDVQGTVEAGSTVTVNSITARVTGTTYTANAIPLSLGPNPLTATATDAAGNTASASITVHLGATINVQGTVDASVTTVSVNGVSATLNAGTFSAMIPMTLGVNTLTATAQDAAGNPSSKTSQAFLARPPVPHP